MMVLSKCRRGLIQVHAFVCALVMCLAGASPLLAQSATSQAAASAGQGESAVMTAADLRRALREGSIDERRLAAQHTRELSQAEQVDVLPDMIDLLRHENDGQIRLSLFDTLMEMGPQAELAVPALVNAIRQRFGGRHNEELHQDYRAALVLSRVGQAAVEGLRNLLLEESESMRAEAAMALGRIGSPAAPAIPDLVLLLDDKSSRVRQDVVGAFGGIGTPAVEALLEASRSEKTQVRAGAITALSLVSPGHPQVVELILTAIDDEVAEVRVAACQALDILVLEPSELARLLLVRLQDDDGSVRNAALNVLVKRPKLLQEMESQLVLLLFHDSDEVAWYAAFLVQGLGPDSLPTLLDAAREPDSRLDQLARAISLIDKLPVSELYDALNSEDARATQLAALALGQIRPISSQTVERLAAELGDADEQLLIALLKSLSSIGKQASQAVPIVRGLAGQDSEEIRRQIVEILFLAAPRDQQLLEDLKRFAQDSGATVQLSAIAALQALGPTAKSAIPVVMESLGSPNQLVRNAVLGFLGSHGPAASSSVARLRRELDNASDADWRVSIIDTLGSIGRGAQPAYPDLAESVRDKSPQIRQACVRTLSKLDLDLQDLGPHLLEALRDSDESVSSEASSSIRRLGANGVLLVPDLLLLLEESQLSEGVQRLLDRFERYQTAPSSIEALVGLMEHENPKIQQAAIRFVGLAGAAAKSALPRLQSLADSQTEAIRSQAVEAITNIERQASP